MKTYEVEVQVIYTYRIEAACQPKAETYGQLALARGERPLKDEIVSIEAEELEPGNVPEEPVRRTDQKQGGFPLSGQPPTKMTTRTTMILLATAVFACGQVFYSQEEFYGYLEHRQRMAAIEADAYRCAMEHQEAERQEARAKEQQLIVEALEDELFSRALRAMGR
jgi:hypothetical protein